MARLFPWLAAAIAGLLILPAELRAQKVEVTPFIGYRAGDYFFGPSTGRILDDNGASSVGVIADVLFGSPTFGTKVEGLFSRQRVRVDARQSPFDKPVIVGIDVDQVQVGGIYELSDGRARPFLSGLAGFTRYGAPAASEFRLSLGGGAGVKLFATPHLGLRLDGRVYSTFVDSSAAGVCGGNGCVLFFRVSPAWQFDATAGLIVAF